MQRTGVSSTENGVQQIYIEPGVTYVSVPYFSVSLATNLYADQTPTVAIFIWIHR